MNGVAAFWVEQYSGSCTFILPGCFCALPVLRTRRFAPGEGEAERVFELVSNQDDY